MNMAKTPKLSPLAAILAAPRETARVPLMKLPRDVARAARARGAKTWTDINALIATGQRTPRCKTRMSDAERLALRAEVQRFSDALTVQLRVPVAIQPLESVKPIFTVLARQRPDVSAYGLREDRKPRRKQRGEIYSTEDSAPPLRKVLRVTTDAALERMLGPFLFAALAQIRAAYLAAFGSGGVARCASLEARVDGAGAAGGAVDRSGAWTDYARRLTPQQAAVAIGVAVRGETLREVEREYRRRNGWAAEHLRAACEVWYGNGAVLKRKRLRLRAWRA